MTLDAAFMMSKWSHVEKMRQPGRAALIAFCRSRRRQAGAQPWSWMRHGFGDCRRAYQSFRHVCRLSPFIREWTFRRAWCRTARGGWCHL